MHLATMSDEYKETVAKTTFLWFALHKSTNFMQCIVAMTQNHCKILGNPITMYNRRPIFWLKIRSVSLNLEQIWHQNFISLTNGVIILWLFVQSLKQLLIVTNLQWLKSSKTKQETNI